MRGDRAQIRIEIEHASHTFYRGWDCGRWETANVRTQRGGGGIVRDFQCSRRTIESDGPPIDARLGLFAAIDGAVGEKRHRRWPVVRGVIGKPQLVVLHEVNSARDQVLRQLDRQVLSSWRISLGHDALATLASIGSDFTPKIALDCVRD